MAKIQISASIDEHALYTIFGAVAEHDSSHIVINAGTVQGTYYGNFSYDVFGNVSGTLTGFSEVVSGFPSFSASGLNVSAGAAQKYINANLIQPFLQLALSGNDQYVLTPGTHLIDGYGGYNTVSEPFAYANASVSGSVASLSISATTSHDTLVNIQGVYFTDGFYNANSRTFSAITPSAGFHGLDLTKSGNAPGLPETYSGPVVGVQKDYISASNDNLSISLSTDNWFIHTGGGTDAVAVHGGTNVLDGGTGSNFLTGGDGIDTFFVDDRIAATDIWSTVVGFHAGDAATVWGVAPQDFTMQWSDNQGAAGFSGLTLGATAPGRPNANLTLAGFSSVDLSSGRLTVSYGADPASGSNYMSIQAH